MRNSPERWHTGGAKYRPRYRKSHSDHLGAIADQSPKILTSASPTAHTVQIANRAKVYAKCAIDALGIPAMLDTDVVIESLDPSTSEPITVTV
jgi:hypothetical protein